MATQANSASCKSLSISDSFHNEQIRSRLKSLVRQCLTFSEVCAEAEGALPTDVLHQLLNLHAESRTAKLTQILQTVTTADRHPPDLCFGELENLLIDYDWRFDKATAGRLYRLLRDFESVLCLGTPTVFALLCPLRRRDFLVDRNPLYSEIFGQAEDRVAYESVEDWNAMAPNRTFDAVLLDPPWYLTSYFVWITVALRLLEPGGTLFLPVFPRLLRETAQWEISVLTKFLASLGTVSFLPCRLQYETPSFEKEYFARLKLPALYGWRSAQLLAVRISGSARSVVAGSIRASRDQWSRSRFGAAVVAVKRSGELEPTSVNRDNKVFFLDSVSRQDNRRQRITAISSRNMATCSHLSAVLEIQIRTMQKLGGALALSDPLVEAATKLGFSHA